MQQFFSRVLPLAAGILLNAMPATADEKFRVCADPLNPPFSDRNGKGFENKIAELFAKELDKTVEYTWFPQRIGFIRNTLKAKLPDTDEYKCDVVMGVPAGYELTLTTRPYYRSAYVLVYVKNKAWDDLESIEDLANLPPERKKKIRFAMFDRGPGTAWLQQNGMISQSTPYQSMSGDPDNNTAMILEKDLKAGAVDMVIIWGPLAGYIVSASKPGTYGVLPMKSGPGMKFEYSIAMGVRHGDKETKARLDRLIEEKSSEIKQILLGYNIPLLELDNSPEQEREQDDD
ncbi:MAG: quinoprotein dehydrogenase-associated putative ABC transporter substrate-binding protein [Pseudomonadota bacterium]